MLALSCFLEPVLLCDVASDDKWPIVWVNDRFARETGERRGGGTTTHRCAVLDAEGPQRLSGPHVVG